VKARICALLRGVEFMTGLPAHVVGEAAQSIERAVYTNKADAARRLRITQPRLNDLL
jgi:hypothetical protein